jgi:hypothetical protein
VASQDFYAAGLGEVSMAKLLLFVMLALVASAYAQPCAMSAQRGNITASTDGGGTVTVVNTAGETYEMSVLTLALYDVSYADPVPLSAQTLNVTGVEAVSLDTPDCSYRIQVVCGSDYLEPRERQVIASLDVEGTACVPESRSFTPEASVSVLAKPLGNMTFELTCVAQGFHPSGYSWYFGDTLVEASTRKVVTHTYPKPNTDIVACSASSQKTAATGIAQIIVA